MTELLYDTNVWFVLSFVIFAAILVKFGLPAVNTLLDTRIKSIKQELVEAENLRVEAQEMLAQYQRKHRDAVKEATDIINKAKESAEEFRQQAHAELEEVIQRREKQLEERLERMEQNALNEIQAYAADLAMEAAREIIIDSLDKKVKTALVKQSIQELENNVH